MKTLLKNCNLFTATDNTKCDIFISDGKISKIGLNLTPSGETIVYDLEGFEVYPSGIDVHTHLGLVLAGQRSPDDFRDGTISALRGGTTTVIDYIVPQKNESLLKAFDKWRAEAEYSSVDYAGHMSLVGLPDLYFSEFPKLKDLGIGTLKCFGGYKGWNMQNDEQMLKILEIAKRYSYLVLLHSENGFVISYLEQRLRRQNKTRPEHHHLAHPSWAEGESTHRAIKLAQFIDTPLYIVHISCAESAYEVAKARMKGLPIIGESCPHYLLLSEDVHSAGGLESAKYLVTPPLRPKCHQEELWKHIINGDIQIIGTDNASYSPLQKSQGLDDFSKVPSGLPAVGLRIPLLYTYGVKRNKISRQKFVEITSTNPAKIFGLQNRKGNIAVGLDADILVIDPNVEYTLTDENDPHNVGYSAFKGFNIECGVKYLFHRGRLVVQSGEYCGRSGDGEFLKLSGLDNIRLD